MRLKHAPVLLIFLFVFTLLVPSCSVEQTASVVVQIQEKLARRQKNLPPQAAVRGLVTLEPPYKGWNWSKEKKRMSVANAAYAITRQVGIGYNADKSFKITGELCEHWSSPNFENKPWRDALAEVLAPVNLTYVMENSQVVLMTREAARKREQDIEQLRVELGEFLAELQPRRLADAIIILPLLDSDGRTSGLGALVATLGMLKASYAPEKILNLHIPLVTAVFDEKGYHLSARSISADERDQVARRLGAKGSAIGTLVRFEKGFKITLNFDGEFGKREFSISGAEEDLYEAPQWIAQRIHEYCRLKLSPEQERYVALPELRDTASLLEFADLDRDYWNGRTNERSWKRLLERNPDSAYLLYRLYSVSGHENWLQFDVVASALKKHGNHQLLRCAEAQAAYRTDYPNCVRQYLALVRQDFRNPALYDWMDNALMALEQGESAQALYDFWGRNDPDSYIPLLMKGEFLISYAWAARGAGWSGTVSEDSWQKFRERLQMAEEVLLEASKKEPGDPGIGANLITVARGLGREREQMERWFQMAVQADPTYVSAYENKLTYLMPKWHGDYEGREMFAFARECASKPPKGSRVAFVLVNAHREMASRWSDRRQGDWKIYYQENPAAYKEVKEVYDDFLRENPDSMEVRNALARIAFAARDYPEAVRQFEIIRNDIDRSLWREKEFYEARKEAYEKTGRI